MILSGNRFAVSLLEETRQAGNAEQPPPNLAKQVADLLVQASQLQKSLEALDAALKAQLPPAASPEENK